MVLDNHLFRTPEGLALIKESQKRRFQDPGVVDQIVELDDQARQFRYQYSELRKKIKANQLEIAKIKKADKSQSVKTQLALKKKLEQELTIVQQQEKETTQLINQLLSTIGNLVASSVPISKDEQDNQILRTFGEIKQELTVSPTPPHHQLLAKIGGYDSVRGSKIAGHRGYFLTGIGYRLYLALQQYALDFLEEREYLLMQPPYFMKANLMAQTAELADFQETLYQTEVETNDPKFLIATAEQPISAYHAQEVLLAKELPKYYAGFSSCFRKEAGHYGKETWGVFRVHQFEKVEQFVICRPEESNKLHEQMMKVSEEFYQSLNIPYRVVAIVSGALNLAASQKYDLEAWFPSYGEYKELVSCSNCTDYQARSLNIKYNVDSGKPQYVHLLNGTLCALQRTICCLLENYYTPEGIQVPEVLQPYLKGRTLIPFLV